MPPGREPAAITLSVATLSVTALCVIPICIIALSSVITLAMLHPPGKFGKLSDCNPLFFAALYSVNRHDTAPALHWWVHKGCNVVLDRCVVPSARRIACSA